MNAYVKAATERRGVSGGPELGIESGARHRQRLLPNVHAGGTPGRDRWRCGIQSADLGRPCVHRFGGCACGCELPHSSAGGRKYSGDDRRGNGSATRQCAGCDQCGLHGRRDRAKAETPSRSHDFQPSGRHAASRTRGRHNARPQGRSSGRRGQGRIHRRRLRPTRTTATLWDFRRRAISELTITQANKILATGVLSEFAGLIDGQYAASMADLRTVLAVGANTLWASTIPNATTGNNASPSLRYWRATA